ncbi:MAG: response regulator [Deltaproteobacteria bacterium]|nr:response regulator [Deltaproteobacteria bacterium]
MLAVEDDVELRDAIRGVLAPSLTEFRGCATVGEARRLLAEWTPDAVLLDVALPDGTAFDLLREIGRREPTPFVVAISGKATSADAFRLAQLGVRAYLRKPFGMPELREALRIASTESPDLEPHVRQTVGRRPLRTIETDVRRQLVGEALARSGGSRRAAARLLRISRQHLQYILRRKPT